METLSESAGKPGKSGKCPVFPGRPTGGTGTCGKPPFKGVPPVPAFPHPGLGGKKGGVKKESFSLSRPLQASERGKVFKQKERQMKNSSVQRSIDGRRRSMRPTPSTPMWAYKSVTAVERLAYLSLH